MSYLTKDHLGREMSADDIIKHLAKMLGWGNTPPWPVLERNIREVMARVRDASQTSPRRQTQAALEDQLDRLEKLAVDNGLYDAHDWMLRIRHRQESE